MENIFYFIGIAALALGLISVGSCNGDVTSAILQCMIEKSETDLKDTHARFLALGIGLCYLQKQVCFVFLWVFLANHFRKELIQF